MNLERLLARRPDGIFINPFERGEIGPDLYRAACRMGREGIISKEARQALSIWPVEALVEDQEPAASGDGAGDGFLRANCHVGEIGHAGSRRTIPYETAIIAKSALGDNPDDICSD
jgi:hypothetical protein